MGGLKPTLYSRRIMSLKKKHHGYVNEQGILSLDDIVSFKQDLLNHKNKKVSIIIERKRKHRSNNQNAYFHKVIVEGFSECSGYTLEESKSALAYQFLREEKENGLTIVKSTSQLSTVEFEEFCSKCRMLASEMFNYYIPMPNEVSF